MKETVLEQTFYNLETVGLLLQSPKHYVNLQLASQHLLQVLTDTISYIEKKEPSTKPQLPEIGELLGVLGAAKAESGKRNIETEYERMMKMYEITLRLLASVEERYGETTSIRESVEEYFEYKLCSLCTID